MKVSTKVHDFYDNISEFEGILEVADDNVTGQKNIQFVEDTKKKYKEYGGGMFWSDAQNKYLRRLAEDE